MKTAIYYYSLTGNTRRVCSKLSEILNCYIEEIIDLKQRRGFCNLFKNGFDSMFNRETTIKEVKISPEEFDMVIIGTPIWTGKIPPAIRTFVSNNTSNIKDYALVFTYKLELSKKAIESIEKLLKSPPSGIASCSQRSIEEDNFNEELESLVKTISIYT